MATPITPTRNTVYVEEVDAKSAISEVTARRIGASINFIINKIYDRLFFEWSQVPRVTTYGTGINGLRYIYKQSDISWYVLSVVNAGSSGSNEVNFDVYDENNILLGNLFSVAPSIASGAGNRAVIGRDVENSLDILSGPNKVSGTLNYTTLGAGWSIVPKLTNAQVDSRHLFFELILKEV
jgi:hypothetical protein